MATNNATNTSNPISVAQGGSGRASTTAYAVICGGTTTTGPEQSIASVGTSGQILTSNGAGALPTFQAAAGVGGSLVLLQSQTASSSATLDFTTGTNLYAQILVVFYAIQGATAAATLNMRISNNAGSTYVATSYQSGCNVAAYNTATWTNTNSTTAFLLTGGIKNTDGNSTANGMILIGNANVGAKCFISGTSTYQDNTSSNATMVHLGGQSGDTGANAFRFLMSSGNIAQGTISLYGIKTS